MSTPRKTEKSPAKKGNDPSKTIGKKMKASTSTSSSSETEGSMSVYSDDTAGTSRSSSRSSSNSRSPSTGSSVYGTAPVDENVQGQNISDLSHSEYIPEYSSSLL